MDDLERFVTAQEPVYTQVRAELAAGRKRTHWMWFVFPQLRGLGHSAMARRYGIASPAEARAYAGHPVLGSRLRECTSLMLAQHGLTALEILGTPDDLKFQSCMTLFAWAAPADPGFTDALARYYAGATDPRTTAMLMA